MFICVTSVSLFVAASATAAAGLKPMLPSRPAGFTSNEMSLRVCTNGSVRPTLILCVRPASSTTGFAMTFALEVTTVRPSERRKSLMPVSERRPAWTRPRLRNWSTPTVSRLKSMASGSSAPSARPGVSLP